MAKKTTRRATRAKQPTMKVLIEFAFPGVTLNSPEGERATEDLEADLSSWSAQFDPPYKWAFMDGGQYDEC